MPFQVVGGDVRVRDYFDIAVFQISCGDRNFFTYPYNGASGTDIFQAETIFLSEYPPIPINP
jgi:hypothetical protein